MTETRTSRWTYSAHKVTVGDNHQNVRKFTAGERKRFAMKSREIREGKADANDLPFFVVSLAAVDPPVTVEEAEDMPVDLLDACVAKIMELSGFSEDEAAKGAEPEKKAVEGSPPSS